MVRTRRAVRKKKVDEIDSHLNREYYENEYEYRSNDYKSQIYSEISHIYYRCDDLDSCYGMQNNSIYRNDISDRFTEIQKTNSIYSNL